MKIFDGKVRLSDLAKRLGVTNQSLRNHLKNGSGLSDGAEKLGESITAEWLLPIDSVKAYIGWAYTHSKKLDMGTLMELEKELNA